MTTYILQLKTTWKEEGERRGKLSLVRGRIKKFLGDGGFGDWGREGRGPFLRGMKRVLYTADGERFREKVFIGRSSEIRYGSYLQHTVPYKGYLSSLTWCSISFYLWSNRNSELWEDSTHLNYTFNSYGTKIVKDAYTKIKYNSLDAFCPSKKLVFHVWIIAFTFQSQSSLRLLSAEWAALVEERITIPNSIFSHRRRHVVLLRSWRAFDAMQRVRKRNGVRH